MRGHSLIFLGIAAAAGMMMAIQGSVNSILGEKIGLAETNFFVHITAAIILIIILLFFKNSEVDMEQFKNIPWYLYIGGILAVAITYGVMMSIPELGVAVATTSIVTMQVLTATVIDHFGIFGVEKIPFNWMKLAGIVFLAVGVRLLLHQ